MYVFGDYELDTALYELRYAGEPRKLEPRVFNALAYLVQHREQVVTREALLDHLWPGLFNSVSLLNNCIMEARKAVGDSGQIQRVIQTIHGRGYRFIAPTTEPCGEHPPRTTPVLVEVPLATAPPSQARVALVAPGTGTMCVPFQDVLAGDQTVGTVVCGTFDLGDVWTVDVGCAVVPRLRQTFFALAQEEAQQYAGTFTFFGADGVLMLFTQEAHAQRAVRAALALHQRVQEQVTALDARLPVDVTVRFGMHTGPMAMPSLTDVPWDASWSTAETTTFAVWLHYLALPGTLLTSQATLPFLHEAVQWVEHGVVRVPGQATPIMAYRLRASGASDTCLQA